ncbi:hypothetical protein [Nocardia transvalensis]|uniref:hypothetical protein n=1 Tax=Nocardia transvalensis TaxID=37333 RepID=UPI001894E77F|nr:hypothetical protein [Nocardia transvalensis]MBF6331929.1 hypothetical protein [Nocardia transvalensis]
MTTEEHPASELDSQSKGIHEIPLVVIRDEPAAGSARESLLQAIAREAGAVADLQPGNAAGALAELARAYALVTSTEVAATATLTARGSAHPNLA